ncbi:MAG: hypothetical protein M1829_006324 [Trizodia sp. TS-e1964]|nr:MAG: hypothetical protein M1829_006324 [Trizodia sp. TS-e1964]
MPRKQPKRKAKAKAPSSKLALQAPLTMAAAEPATTTTQPPSTPAPAAPDTPSRGIPYYEKLRRDLRETLQKKRLLDKSLATLDEQIYKAETAYLEDAAAGNIIKGFDAYIKAASTAAATASTAASGATASRRKPAIADADRVFSRASAAFLRDSTETSSAVTTPSVAVTPSSATFGAGVGVVPVGGAAGSAAPLKGALVKRGGAVKKGGSALEEEPEEAKPVKRARMSFGRGGE